MKEEGNQKKMTRVAVLKNVTIKLTVICLSIGTPKSNKFSICSKCKINYF